MVYTETVYTVEYVFVYGAAVYLIRIDRCTLSSVLSIYERRIHNIGMRDSCTITCIFVTKKIALSELASILGEKAVYYVIESIFSRPSKWGWGSCWLMTEGGGWTTVGGPGFGFVGRSSIEIIITTRNADRAASDKKKLKMHEKPVGESVRLHGGLAYRQTCAYYPTWLLPCRNGAHKWRQGICSKFPTSTRSNMDSMPSFTSTTKVETNLDDQVPLLLFVLFLILPIIHIHLNPARRIAQGHRNDEQKEDMGHARRTRVLE